MAPRRSTAPLEAAILPDAPPPRASRGGVLLVGGAFLAILALVAAAIWGVASLATQNRDAPGSSQSLVDRWETPSERLAALRQAMNSHEVGCSAGELRDLSRLFTRIANAGRSGDDEAFRKCIDLDLLVRRISRHPAARADRTFSTWNLKSQLEYGISGPSQVGEFSIVRVEPSSRADEALVYTVDWSTGYTTACRWWLVRKGRNWRMFDWERLDAEQSMAFGWAVQNKLYTGALSSNYQTHRSAEDMASGTSERVWQPASDSVGAALAAAIDLELPEEIHDLEKIDLGWALIGQNRPADAIRACDQVRRPEEHPGHFIVQARAHADLGRHAQALDCAKRYQELAGRDPLALDEQADALELLDRYPEAADCWREMLRLAPNHEEALANFCRLADEQQRGEVGEIVRRMRKPLEAAMAQAVQALYRDDLETFATLSEFIRKESPDSPAIDALEAHRLEHEGQHEQAAALYRQAAQREPLPPKKEEYFGRYLSSMAAAGKAAEAYALADDPATAFTHLTGGFDEEEAIVGADQMPALLAAHRKRQPGDARTDYYEGLLLLRDEKYAEADEKLKAALSKANEDDRELFQSRRIETLYRLGRIDEAYDTYGHSSGVFQELARHCENDDNWTALAALLARHKGFQPGDLWVEYYQAKLDQKRGDLAAALNAIRRTDQADDESLKSLAHTLKVTLLVEAGRVQEAYFLGDDRRDAFLDLAARFRHTRNWQSFGELAGLHADHLRSDPVALDLWTAALWQQEKYETIVPLLDFEQISTLPAAPGQLERLHDRQVRSLLRLGRIAEARSAAESASAKLDHHLPLVMVLLAERNFTAVREKLTDAQLAKALMVRSLHDDPELRPLIEHSELEDLRHKLVLPLPPLYPGETSRIVLLLREPIELTAEQLAERVRRLPEASDVQVVPIQPVEGDSRRSFRIDTRGTTFMATLGPGPYTGKSTDQQAPKDEALASVVREHQGFIILAGSRSDLELGANRAEGLMGPLAAEFCDAGALGVFGWHQATGLHRLAVADSTIAQQLRSRSFLGEKSGAADTTFLYDAQQFDDARDEEAVNKSAAARRAIPQMARAVRSGRPAGAAVCVDFNRAQSRERIWLKVVAAEHNRYGGWKIHGELPHDSALWPHLRQGMKVAVESYEILDVRMD